MSSIRKISSPLARQALALDSTPDSLLSAAQWDLKGTLLKPGSRSTVTRVEFENRSYVFKQYKALSLHRRLRYALTRSRAQQSWENGQTLADLGIPVVRPIAFFEESSWGIPRRSLLIMPFLKGTPLDQYSGLQEIEPTLRKIFRTMAKHRITHGDLKANNILVDDEGRPHFIDIDASKIHNREASYLKARKKDQERFLRNWQNHPEGKDAFGKIFSQHP